MAEGRIDVGQRRGEEAEPLSEHDRESIPKDHLLVSNLDSVETLALRHSGSQESTWQIWERAKGLNGLVPPE